MTRPLFRTALALALFALLGSRAPHARAAGGFKVVANAANPTKSLGRAEVAELFLRKRTQWPAGVAAVPVDQSAVSEVRQSFSLEVMNWPVAAVVNYWQQQLFAGRGVPPAVKQSDVEVLAFVAQTPGAVGYVTPETPLPPGVVVLEIVK